LGNYRSSARRGGRRKLARVQHDDLGGCFGRVKQYIDALLQEIIEPALQSGPFVGAALRCR